MELGDQVVVRILGAEVGLGVTVFFVVSVGRVAPLDAGLVVIVADLAAVDSVGAEVTLCPRPCYKTSNYFLSSRLALCCLALRPCDSIKVFASSLEILQFVGELYYIVKFIFFFPFSFTTLISIRSS